MANRKGSKNIYGQPLTLKGTVDQRHGRHPKIENDGKPYMVYDVVERQGDDRPWHVIAHVLDSGERSRISRHRLAVQAERVAERLRLKQPNRREGKRAHLLKHRVGYENV